ncbi:Tetratricopeptide repeat protein [Enhygromyxa salina]|uniref:Tetratricopeptide repeat protein n=1 Tax=Enhygromyxa salina TaxID=215803 RepID=A0A2S9YNP9_9BACT|nr:Tetratricopeptide repeat protein [Enhygromyxa salina]
MWALSKREPWDVELNETPEPRELLEVCLRAPELASLEPGSRVLLRVRAEDLGWLNVYRPIFADKQLRVVLWIEEAVLDGLMRQAVDFFDWVSRLIPVPSKPAPDFAVAGVRAALAAGVAFSWRGEWLEETLQASGAKQDTVRIQASRPYREILERLREPGLVIAADIRSERDAWRVRMALAHVGRDDVWVADNPEVELPGMWSLHARQIDWDTATAQLTAAGWQRPALVAAWLELEAERVEAALEHPDGPPPDTSEWDPQQLAIAEAPAFVLRQRAGDPTVVAARTALQLAPLPIHEAARVTWSAGRGVDTSADQPASCPAVLVRRIRIHGPTAGAPTEALVDDAQVLQYEDVALELALVRASHSQGVRPDQLVAWLATRGRTRDAIAWCERWMESARQQADNDNVLSALGWAGDLHLKIGESVRAQRYFEDGKALAEQLRASDPASRISAMASRFSARLGDIYRLVGDTQRARVCHEESLAVRQRLLAAEPEDALLRAAVADAHQQLGDVCYALGEFDSAAHHHSSSLALRTQLGDPQPHRGFWHQRALVNLDRIAAVPAQTGPREQAIASYQSILARQERQVEFDPSNLESQANLAVFSNSLGSLHFEAKQFEEAKTFHEQALYWLSGLVRAEPDRVDRLAHLSTTYNKLGDVYFSIGESAPARACYERAFAQREDLVNREPRRTDFADKLAASYARLGDVHLATGRVERARELFKLSVEVTEPLVDRDPDDYQLKLGLSGGYHRMALVDEPNALTWLSRAIERARECVERAPTAVAARHQLGLALSQLGNLLRAEGDEARATAALQEAADLLGTLEPRVTLEFGDLSSRS